MIYTFGYTGLTMEAVKKKAEELDAYVLDIRYMAGSRAPVWRKGNFASALKERYIHVQALGNENYKGGLMKLHDFEAGMEYVKKILPFNNVMLMCACTDVRLCHRRIVAKKLSEQIPAHYYHLAKDEFVIEKKKKESIQPLKLF